MEPSAHPWTPFFGGIRGLILRLLLVAAALVAVELSWSDLFGGSSLALQGWREFLVFLAAWTPFGFFYLWAETGLWMVMGIAACGVMLLCGYLFVQAKMERLAFWLIVVAAEVYCLPLARGEGAHTGQAFGCFVVFSLVYWMPVWARAWRRSIGASRESGTQSGG